MILAMTGMLGPEETKIILRRKSLLGEMAEDKAGSRVEEEREAPGKAKGNHC